MYEIQTYTICDGWVNTWHDGKGTPTTYKTFGEALEAIDEHLQEMKDDGMEEDRNTYRIKFLEIVK